MKETNTTSTTSMACNVKECRCLRSPTLAIGTPRLDHCRKKHMVQNIDRVISSSNLSVPSPIPDTIFNTNSTKNQLNLVTSIEMLSGLGRNYEFNRLRSKHSQIKP